MIRLHVQFARGALDRGSGVYVVPRVEGGEGACGFFAEMVPGEEDLAITAHGQMDESELEPYAYLQQRA